MLILNGKRLERYACAHPLKDEFDSYLGNYKLEVVLTRTFTWSSHFSLSEYDENSKCFNKKK